MQKSACWCSSNESNLYSNNDPLIQRIEPLALLLVYHVITTSLMIYICVSGVEIRSIFAFYILSNPQNQVVQNPFTIKAVLSVATGLGQGLLRDPRPRP